MFVEEYQRYVTPKEIELLNLNLEEVKKRIMEKEMIKSFVDFKKAKKIIDFLIKIPNLKLCLTYEQKLIL